MPYKVGEVSKLSGISVRTLHHYESRGLLVPSHRSESGYRLYTDGDLQRLQQILFYKTLNFSLDDIHNIMTDPKFDYSAALYEQRDLIEQQKNRMQSVLNLIDKTIVEFERDKTMNIKDKFAAFADFESQQFEEEVQQRWGDTDAFKESARRTKNYNKEDWTAIKNESGAIVTNLADLLAKGKVAQDEEVLRAIEQYRLHFDRWFYPCSKAMHALLGQMYISDQRFFDNYKKVQPGLAQFICDATRANASIEN